MTTTIGIDIGTSAVKAVILDDGVVVAHAHAPLPIAHPKSGWAEQSPRDWINATGSVLRQLRVSAPGAYAATAALGLSGQMHGAVALGKDLQPLRPAILWNDARAADEAAEIQRKHPGFAEIAGALCMGSFVAPKIVWLRENEPGVHSSLAHIVMPKDFVRLWLTGELATDMVDAAGSWFLDERRRQWSDEICNAIGIDERRLPRLLEGPEVSGAMLTSVATELGFLPPVLVIAGAGDAAAGSLGLGMIRDGDAFVSLGTSCQLFVTTAAYRPNVARVIHSFAHALPGLWFQMAAMLNGASALAWWSRICGADPGDMIAEAEQGAPDAACPIFLPYLQGERTPHNDPHLRGVFTGLGADTDRPQMTRAVLEGVAFTICDARSALVASGVSIDSLALTGGGAKSGYWSQLIANAVGLPVTRFRDGDVGPALGVARLAIMAISHEDALTAFTKPQTLDVAEPSLEAREQSERRLARWRNAYKAGKDVAQ
jgi:xylulokinase